MKGGLFEKLSEIKQSKFRCESVSTNMYKYTNLYVGRSINIYVCMHVHV